MERGELYGEANRVWFWNRRYSMTISHAKGGVLRLESARDIRPVNFIITSKTFARGNGTVIYGANNVILL